MVVVSQLSMNVSNVEFASPSQKIIPEQNSLITVPSIMKRESEVSYTFVFLLIFSRLAYVLQIHQSK